MSSDSASATIHGPQNALDVSRCPISLLVHDTDYDSIDLYGIPPRKSKPLSNNSLGVFAISGGYTQSDLDGFWSKYASFVESGTGPITVNTVGASESREIVGPGELEDGEGEEVLDIEMATPIIYPTNVTVFNAGRKLWIDSLQVEMDSLLDVLVESHCHSDSDDSSSDLVQPILGGFQGSPKTGTSPIPNVLSISYGGDESGYTPISARRLCYDIMKMGLIGMTVVVSSGDSGIGPDTCPGDEAEMKKLEPSFPASCSFVTTVGATKAVVSGGNPMEIAAEESGFSSGGAFLLFTV